MDEIGFGPKREARPPSRRLRAWVAAAAIAGAAVTAIAIAVTAAGARQPATLPPTTTQPAAAAAAAPVLRPPSAICPPAQPAWPSLADLPAGMHAGAVPIVVGEQFSGVCPAR